VFLSASGEIPAVASAPASGASASPATDGPRCRDRIAAARAAPSLPGTPEFDRQRVELLGRARGEPMVFVREPAATREEDLPAALRPSWKHLLSGPPGIRVSSMIKRHEKDPAALRALFLREGYLYSPNPHDALALTTGLHVGDLFDVAEVWLQRGSEVHHLKLTRVRGARLYHHEGGSLAGREAELIFGDRVALAAADLGAPLHRDLRALAESEGFERTAIEHRGEGSLVARLRFDGAWASALIESEGARLSLACLDEGAEAARVAQARTLPRRQALARVSEAVTAITGEVLRFDRPEGEKTAERDGQLRPVWFSAYLRGAAAFGYDGHSYQVYDSSGKPYPPEVCVDFVLDSFERAQGTWFTPRGELPARVRGGLDLDGEGIKNRRGVLAFAVFAASRPELFTVRYLPGEERVPFGERTRFFQYLLDHADEFHPGDILAIQGRKRDGLIHQHAILLERTDPVTGFAYGVADQMKRPRRRTWEGIMAEAPLRSLLYRIHPSDRMVGAAPADRGEIARGPLSERNRFVSQGVLPMVGRASISERQSMGRSRKPSLQRKS
jgi:hypothetical protein